MVRVTIVSPGFTVSELSERGGDAPTQAAVRAATAQLGLPASAVAETIAYAFTQPSTVDVTGIIVRPTLQG